MLAWTFSFGQLTEEPSIHVWGGIGQKLPTFLRKLTSLTPQLLSFHLTEFT